MLRVLRSVHRQEPPYRPLGDVVKGQSVSTRGEMSGALMGVRSPAWVGRLNVPGYPPSRIGYTDKR
jgi:acetolactate decarboxylase